jgi:ketosteroid isomerase-like protein
MDLATLQHLVDRQEINEVLQRYARGIDAFDFDVVSDVFTADAAAQYSKYPELIGGPAIAQFLREHTQATSWHQHLLTVVEVVIDGDRATTLTYFIAHMVSGDPGETVTVQVGDYRDELVRTAGGWRISKRRQLSGLKERRPL